MSRLRSVTPTAFQHARCSEHGGAALAAIGMLAAACAVTSAVLWTMHLSANSSAVPEFSKAVAPSPALDAAQAPGASDALARMFGAPAQVPAAGTREIEGVQLQGIVSDPRGSGVALFSVDGAPPLRVRAGGQVRDGVTLVEIKQQQVVLERGGRSFELTLLKRSVPLDAPSATRQRNSQTQPPGSAVSSAPAPSVR